MNKPLISVIAILACNWAFAINLIPDNTVKAPNYWCSWNEQGRANRKAKTTEIRGAGDQGVLGMRDRINEDYVFGPDGWADRWSEIRADLYFCLDDGWDVPYGVQNPFGNAKDAEQFGSLIVDQERFPSFGGTPAQRLKKINDELKKIGWRGAGIWVAANAQGENRAGKTLSPEAQREYWKERILWSKEAGVEYWKVDWGVHERSAEFRKMLTDLGQEYYPQLWIEHALPGSPLTSVNFDKEGKMSGNGAYPKQTKQTLDLVDALCAFSKAFRTYDIVGHLGWATTIDRAAYQISAGHAAGNDGYLNVEDMPQLAASISACMGIMGSYKSSTRNEPIKAMNWFKIAPPMPFKDAPIKVSEERLNSEWVFKKGEVWFNSVIGKNVIQSAPAIVVRGNVDIPKVSVPSGEPAPYIVASLHKNGAFAITSMPRSQDGKDWRPACDVDVNLDILGRKVGIFWSFNKLRFKLSKPADKVRVLAQELISDEAVDITEFVRIADGKIEISQTDLNRAAPKRQKGDWSFSAFVVLVEEK